MTDRETTRRTFESWIGKNDDVENPATPAATVIVVRDTEGGPETLMLRRNSKLGFVGGMWVFPGGKLDPEDYGDDADDAFAASRTAAVREAEEEADLVIDPDSMVRYSHWMPPKIAPRRFATWFFVARAPEGPEGDVTIDNGEIVDEAWWRPADFLDRHAAEEVEMAPPTWITLWELAQHDSVDAILSASAVAEPRFYVTRVAKADHPTAMWTGDAGYDTGDLSVEGDRHRLTMARGGWTFERTV